MLGLAPGLVALVVAAALLAPVFAVARWGAGWLALCAGALAVVAEGAIVVVQATPQDRASETLAGVLVWALAAGAAVAAGLGLRAAEARRARTVVEARRAQRLLLARDLHDFVAHDVSEIVVQAQAARVVVRDDVAEAEALLERIERAGVHALAAMDRSVQVLRAGEVGAHDAAESATGAARRYGLDDLPELVERFAATVPARVELSADPAAAGLLDREVDATTYRVAVEALTNVRRHAAGARTVAVRVVREDSRPPATGAALTIAVTDDGAGDASTSLPRRVRDGGGGLGLVGLREQVEALGGTFSAGPLDVGDEGATGWRLTAVLPLREEHA